MTIGKSRPCCDMCDYSPKACGDIEGVWSDPSGTWSEYAGVPYQRTCTTSAGVTMYAPSSGFAAGDRCSVAATINWGTATNAVVGFIFDAIDADNCHRFRITKTGSEIKMALEAVAGGSATLVWESPYNFSGRTYFQIIDIGAYVVETGEGYSYGAVHFPHSGDFARKGGGKFGLFVDSQDGSGVTFTAPSVTFFGQNTCFEPSFVTCGDSATIDWLTKNGITSSQLSIDVDFSGFTPNEDAWYLHCDPTTTYDESWWFPTSVMDKNLGGPSLTVPKVESPTSDDWGSFSDDCRFGFVSDTCYPIISGSPATNFGKFFEYRASIHPGWLYAGDVFVPPSIYNVNAKLWRMHVNRIVNWKNAFGNSVTAHYSYVSDLLSLTDMDVGKTVSISYQGMLFPGSGTPETPYFGTYGPNGTVTFLP